MSRVVKNSRRCSPRARWKMLAPCMTVLSTSKNAAAVGSERVVERGLDLGRGRGRLAGERRALLQVERRVARPVGWRPRSRNLASHDGVWKYPCAWPPDPRPTSRTCSTQAAAEDPDRLAVVEAGGRRVTWGELDDEVGPGRHRPRRGRRRRRPPGDDRARQPDRVRDDLPRACCGPRRSPSRSTRRRRPASWPG